MRRAGINVSPDPGEDMALANRIAVIGRGSLQQYDARSGDYDRLRNLFVAGLLGSPPMNLLPCRYVREDGRAILDFDDFALDAGVFGRALDAATGPSLRFVVRPEDVRVAADGGAAPGSVVEATVYVVEPLGSETIIDYRVGGHLVRVTAPGSFLPRVGEEHRLAFDPAKLHVFDEQTGEALRAA